MAEVDVTLRLTGDIARLALSPGDIVWIKLSGEYEQPQTMHSIAAQTRRMLKAAGHDNQVIISDERFQIFVVTPEPPVASSSLAPPLHPAELPHLTS